MLNLIDIFEGYLCSILLRIVSNTFALAVNVREYDKICQNQSLVNIAPK